MPEEVPRCLTGIRQAVQRSFLTWSPFPYIRELTDRPNMGRSMDRQRVCQGGHQLKNWIDDELRDEITTYLCDIKTDMESYLTWAISEIGTAETGAKAAEVVEDAMHRIMTMAFYMATLFEDSEPAHILHDLASEISEEQSREPSLSAGRPVIDDPANRTRH